MGLDNFGEETKTATTETDSGLVDSNSLKAHADADASSRNASNTNLSFQANAGASGQFNALTDFSGFFKQLTNT